MERREMDRAEEKYMERAIVLAEQGRGWTNPNPVVGAVIVKGEKIIGEGYHGQYGGLHAEREAIAALTEPAEGATMYVTLEPCCHYGKTPPCTEGILEQKIGRVVIGSRDPNPKVAGKGVECLRKAGVIVEEDFLRESCDRLNRVFFHYISTKLPYVVMKYAMTLDGKIATYTGASKWITGEEARGRVQKMRHQYMGIMAGIGTVLADNPMLNVRTEGMKSPIRIICDSHLRIPLDSKICQTAREYPTIMYLLGEQGIDSILLEGGGELNESALNAGIVKEVKAFVAPKIFGGKGAKSPVTGLGAALPNEAVGLSLEQVTKVGEDLLLEYQVVSQKRKGGVSECLPEL